MKVLLIGHNPINSYQNMGKTFMSLFSKFEKEELCQFYIYPSYPDVELCNSYYRVTDKEVLKSLFTFKAPGHEVKKDKIASVKGIYENPNDEQFYRSRKNKSAVRRLLRDFIWKVSRWNNKNLNNWIEREKPTAIFVAPGVAKFLYDIALEISKRYAIPIVVYVCDEYYFVKPREGFVDNIQLKLLQKKIEKLMKSAGHIVTISDELKELYSKEFKVPVTTIMSGSKYEVSEPAKHLKNEPQAISYFGNIRCNRFNSLKEMGLTLDEINKEKNTSYKLKIYSAENDKEILSTFDGVKSIELCGFITGEEFDKAILGSDFLLHVEAFDEQSIDFVKHSVSTKIADSLASGVPFVAYGPAEIASMQHLISKDCAFAATDKKDLKELLVNVFEDTQKKYYYVENALKASKAYHSQEVNSQKLYDLLKEV